MHKISTSIAQLSGVAAFMKAHSGIRKYEVEATTAQKSHLDLPSIITHKNGIYYFEILLNHSYVHLQQVNRL